MNDTDKLLERVQQKDKWLRAMYMVLFLIVLWIVKILFFAVIILQFIIVLLTDQTNENLMSFAKHLSSYAYQMYMFLTYNSDVKPFPFEKWPSD